MFLHRALIFLLAAVLGSLADPDHLKDRHRVYNANTNFNQILGGHNGSPGRDPASDRDRGQSGVVSPPKYDGMMKTSGAGSGKDRGGVYVMPKYLMKGTGSGALATASQSGPVGEIGAGIVGVGVVTSGGPVGASYDTMADGIGYGDAYGGEICDNGYNPKHVGNKIYRYDNDDDKPVWEEPTDDDGSPEGLFIINNNYNVLFKGNRRFIAPQPYVDGKSGWGGNVNGPHQYVDGKNGWGGSVNGPQPYVDGKSGWGGSVNGNPNNNQFRPGYRRTDKWGPLRAAYIVDREPNYAIELPPTYVTEIQPSYMADRQSNYLTDRQSNYVVDRQPNYMVERELGYSADAPLVHSTERQPIYSNELRPYPTTLEPLEPVDEDYDSGYWGPGSMNSNVNYNYVSGRRSNSNSNSNANTNEMGYGGYGSRPERQERYPTTPSYSGYDDEGYGSERLRKNRGHQTGYGPKRNRIPEIRPRPKINEDMEDEEDDNDVADDYMPYGNGNSNTNTNINTNSNTNIMSRRNIPRKRRSLESTAKKSESSGDADNEGTTEATKTANTTTRASVSDKRNGPTHKEAM